MCVRVVCVCELCVCARASFVVNNYLYFYLLCVLYYLLNRFLLCHYVRICLVGNNLQLQQHTPFSPRYERIDLVVNLQQHTHTILGPRYARIGLVGNLQQHTHHFRPSLREDWLGWQQPTTTHTILGPRCVRIGLVDKHSTTHTPFLSIGFGLSATSMNYNNSD